MITFNISIGKLACDFVTTLCYMYITHSIDILYIMKQLLYSQMFFWNFELFMSSFLPSIYLYSVSRTINLGNAWTRAFVDFTLVIFFHRWWPSFLQQLRHKMDFFLTSVLCSLKYASLSWILAHQNFWKSIHNTVPWMLVLMGLQKKTLVCMLLDLMVKQDLWYLLMKVRLSLSVSNSSQSTWY